MHKVSDIVNSYSGKPMRLKNGWLVVLVEQRNIYTPTYQIMKSIDKGKTWVQMCEIRNDAQLKGCDITTDGEKLYLIIHGKTQLYFHAINPISQGNVNIFNDAVNTVIDNQLEISSSSMVYNISSKTLHVIIQSKNTSNSNVFNLRYLRGSIKGDGKIEWGNVEQITNHSYSYYSPIITTTLAGDPIVMVQHLQNAKLLKCLVKKSGVWVENSIIPSQAEWISQINDLITDKSGAIHFVWTRDGGRLYHFKSSNGGMDWDTSYEISQSTISGYTFWNPTITSDKNGDVLCFWNERDSSGSLTNIYFRKLSKGIWSGTEIAVNGRVEWGENMEPKPLEDLLFSIDFSESQPLIFRNSNKLYFKGEDYIDNAAPTLVLNSPTTNQTLHENSTLTLAGNTTDTDIDDVVTVKYQIDSGAVRNLHSAVSDGATPIDFAKTLTYKDGVLKDGNTVLTSILDKDTPHTISIWSEDGKGGKSNIITRTFFVVPNRAPVVTINPIAAQSELINSNVINVSGMVTDADKNDVTVTFAINGGEEQQVYQGPPSAFTFNILLNDLKVGANTIIVKATDTYNTSGAKTLTINKTHNATPVNKAVALYKISAPTGSAKSILLWLSRTLGTLDITTEVSLTNDGEAENFVALEKTNSVVANGLRKEEFAYKGDADKTNIVVKITYNRTDASVIDTIKQISGVLF